VCSRGSKGLECAQALMRVGVDPLIRDSKGLTAMHWICLFGKVKYLQVFRGLKVDDCKDSQGNTLLHAAARKGHTKCISYLINSLSADPNAQNNRKETPLHKVQ
jgi:ankyrin repeat protein